MLKIIILTVSTISLIGCTKANQPVLVAHPDLVIPVKPELPKYNREMINCGRDLFVLDLCRRILLRETVLSDHIETLEELIDDHNLLLSEEPESGN